MEHEETKQLLEQLEEPAFLAKDGAVAFGNRAFHALGAPDGIPLSSFPGIEFGMDRKQPAGFSCTLLGQRYLASTFSVGDSTAYLFRRSDERIPESLLAQAAASLRTAAQQLYAAAEKLSFTERQDAASLSALIQGVFRTERVADSFDYLQKLHSGMYLLSTEQTDLTAEIGNHLQHAAELLMMAGVGLEWDLPATPFVGTVDRKLLALIFWNLLAAAASGGTVSVRVERLHLTQLRLTLRGKRPKLPAGMDFGVGSELSLSLAQAAAQLHGGSVVLSNEGETFTAVASIRTDLKLTPKLSDIRVHGHSLDTGLLALAEILPPMAFDSRDIIG